SGSSSQDVFDSTLVCNKAGLYLFTGSYSPTPLTWKIEFLWRSINPLFFSLVRIAHDVWKKRIYIIAPFFGAVSNPADSPNVFLVGDYQEGLNPQNIKWTIFSFTLPGSAELFAGKTIGKISMELLSPIFSSSIVYKFAFCVGDNNIYTFSDVIGLDLGSRGIYQSLTSGPIYYDRGRVCTYTMIKYRALGSGTLSVGVVGQDTNNFSGSTPPGFNLSLYSGKEFERQINIMSEGLIYQLNNTAGVTPANNFILSRVDVSAASMYNMRPSTGAF
ncbi:MAG TPA: hypothetical protein VNX68_01630, partial [Nitrosopumilaceae archaeon]|nr:hypothetical protein [Nitrosopumilaceae archaeon]